MKRKKTSVTTLNQICRYIPRSLVSEIAKETGVDKQSRRISPWSHVMAHMFAHLSHALSINDICDTLKNHAREIARVRGAKPMSKNGFSHASRTRNPEMAETLFWRLKAHLEKVSPKFGTGNGRNGMPRRFKRVIHVADATTIRLSLNCMDWAQHRRRKAAAKCHVKLNLASLMPTMILVKHSTHEAIEARELCSDLKSGEVCIFDRGYLDFKHLYDLDARGIFWVTRSKKNMSYKVLSSAQITKGRVINDQIILLTGLNRYRDYPTPLRRVQAIVTIDGQDRTMVYIGTVAKYQKIFQRQF